MDDWKCPDGWRIKADDEIVEKGDAYSHDGDGFKRAVPKSVNCSIGWTVGNARRGFLHDGGFVISKTPEPPPEPGPRDTCLTWLSNKIDEAARKHPDKAESLRLDWFAAKSRLAEEMLAKIGGLS